MIVGYRCRQCDAVYLKKSLLCRRCSARDSFEQAQLSGRGRIYSFSTVHAAPARFEKEAPYVLAIIELEEGPRLSGRLSHGEPAIGAEVEIEKIENGIHFFRRV